MNMNLKEIMDTLKLKELETIKNELQPHFEKFGNLYITGSENDVIKIKYHDGVCDWSLDNTVVRVSPHGEFSNKYDSVYTNTKIDIENVYEKIDYFLNEIKVKPFKTFDIEKWKQQFAEKHNLYIKHCGHYIIELDASGYDNTVVDLMDNVNHKDWHKGTLTGNEKFKFDGKSDIFLETKQDCEEFEQVFNDYINSQKYKTLKQLFPNLTVEERESIGLIFADIARSLNIDIMYDKPEEDYFCNAYDITQEKADVILNLIKGEKC